MTQDTPAILSSDAEREQAVAALREHAAEGRLTLEEFASRIGTAYEARTRGELDALLRDLPTPRPSSRARTARARRWLVSVLGGTERRGRFRLADDTVAVAILGGVDLDLRDAEVEAPESRLTVVTLLGGVDVKVPEGVDVELGGFALLGGRDFKAGARPVSPDAPRLSIRAYTVLGGVSVTVRSRS